MARACLSDSSALVCHSAAGRVSCIGRPNNFWAGDNPSFLEGVLQYCRRARARWFWLIARPVHAALSNFFIDFTVASALPLLCGYWGDDVACRKPHCLAKSLNSLEVNCGPPSDQNVSGTPVRQKDALRAEVSCVAVVLLSIGMISGQSE